MTGKGYGLLTSMILALGGAISGYADGFHGTSFAGANGTEMVGMGYAGNEAQSAANRAHNEGNGDGYGAVDYNYWIGKAEVSSSQFATSGVSGGDGSNDNSPVVKVSLYEARMYANWLTLQTNGEGALLAYSDDGKTIVNTRAALVESGELVYVIPTENEWYKAAYYEVDDTSYSLYSTGSDEAPTGGFNYNNANDSVMDVGFSTLEQNGTQDMLGNVWEWCEMGDGEPSFRGGDYNSAFDNVGSSFSSPQSPIISLSSGGFRVAAIPEPGSVALLGLFGGGILFIRRIFIR